MNINKTMELSNASWMSVKEAVLYQTPMPLEYVGGESAWVLHIINVMLRNHVKATLKRKGRAGVPAVELEDDFIKSS